MSWVSLSVLKPKLPQHCTPQNDLLFRFSSTFHTCVPTPLAFLSNVLGTLSIVSWLCAQLPQIYKNWSIGSTSGLSISFLVVWLLGDLGNFLGAIFTHQATWQVAIGAYYVFVDVCLVTQWVYYEHLQHGNLIMRVWRTGNWHRRNGGSSGENSDSVVIEGIPVHEQEQDLVASDSDGAKGHETSRPESRPRIIFRAPTFNREQNEKSSERSSGTPDSNTIARVGPSSPMPSPSPRTMLFMACLIAVCHASPLSISTSDMEATTPKTTALEDAGTILSWLSAVLYLGSRLPQLLKNFRRKSTAGLSPHLFLAAFCGNFFYSCALLTNPCAWNDFGPYGGGGWVGKEGSNKVEWILAAFPFFLGASGVLGLDASVGVQFLLYGEQDENLVVVEREGERKGHLKRVSGWLRGWMPSFSEAQSAEREGLLHRTEQHGEGYGAL